jgi:hypothetical protein
MKVHIERNWATGDWCIYIFEKHGDRLWIGKPMVLEMEERTNYERGGIIDTEPTLRLSDHFSKSDDLMAALADALAQHGFKSDHREKELESVLAAKESHLQDMRNLVFKEVQ